MKMPPLISNRSIITTFYETESDDGYRQVFHSSTGNEAIVDARKAEHIKKDTVATMILTYMASKPYEGGMELNQIIALDIAGRIPDFIKNKIATRLSNIGMQLADYVMHGTVPKALL